MSHKEMDHCKSQEHICSAGVSLCDKYVGVRPSVLNMCVVCWIFLCKFSIISLVQCSSEIIVSVLQYTSGYLGDGLRLEFPFLLPATCS